MACGPLLCLNIALSMILVVSILSHDVLLEQPLFRWQSGTGCNQSVASQQSVTTVTFSPERSGGNASSTLGEIASAGDASIEDSFWDLDLAPGVSFLDRPRCVVGQECTFSLNLSAVADINGTQIGLTQDITVLLRGPTAVAASLRWDYNRLGNSTTTLYASFRIFHAGVYRVVAKADCTEYFLRVPGDLLRDFQIAAFNLTVQPVVPGNFSEDQETPCRFGQDARWILNRTSGEYEWVNYGCAGPTGSPRDIIQKLNGRGFSRIVFAGDSFARTLYQHAQYLLVGNISEAECLNEHGDRPPFEADLDNEHTLTLEYHWIDGIFQNGEFGCSRRGSWSNRTDSFPPVASGHRGNSIFVVNSGIWDADLCTSVERSYIKYVPLFMDWAQSLTTPGDVVVWRTTPPGSLGCRRRSQKLDYTNTIALPLARQRGFLVFQSNLVERPWYQNLCHLHYSCPVKVSEYSWMMYGVVGEATTRYFFDWLVKVLQE